MRVLWRRVGLIIASNYHTYGTVLVSKGHLASPSQPLRREWLTLDYIVIRSVILVLVLLYLEAIKTRKNISADPIQSSTETAVMFSGFWSTPPSTMAAVLLVPVVG